MRVVAVTVDHQVNVHVPQAGQQAHAFSRDDVRAFWNRERADLPDGLDSLALDQDHAVGDGFAAVAVDERAAHKRLDWS